MNCNETYIEVVKRKTVELIILLAAALDLKIEKIDILTPFCTDS